MGLDVELLCRHSQFFPCLNDGWSHGFFSDSLFEGRERVEVLPLPVIIGCATFALLVDDEILFWSDCDGVAVPFAAKAFSAQNVGLVRRYDPFSVERLCSGKAVPLTVVVVNNDPLNPG